MTRATTHILLTLLFFTAFGCASEFELGLAVEDTASSTYELTSDTIEMPDNDAEATVEKNTNNEAVLLPSLGPARWVNLSRKSTIWQRAAGAKSQAKVSGRLYSGDAWAEFLEGYEERDLDTWAVTISTCSEGECDTVILAEIPVDCRRLGREGRTSVSCKGSLKVDGNNASIRYRSEVGQRPASLIFTYKGAMSHDFADGDIESELQINSLDHECEGQCRNMIQLPILLERQGPRLERFNIRVQ
jgi:hypothetical protein